MAQPLLVAALSWLVVCCSGAAWNPYQPERPYGETEFCRNRYGDFMAFQPWPYAACIRQWASPAPYNWTDASKARVVASGNSSEFYGERRLSYGKCTAFCFDEWKVGMQHERSNKRWIFGTYEPDSERCRCYFTGSQDVADILSDTFDIAIDRGSDVRKEQCVAYAVMLPLSCMWTLRGACARQPLNEDGCLWWADEGCCVNAAGYIVYSNSEAEIAVVPIVFLAFAFVMSLFKLRNSVQLKLARRTAEISAGCDEERASRLAMAHAMSRESTFTNEEDDICPICIVSMVPPGPVVSLPCTHAFHLACFETFLARQPTANPVRCPVCRDHIVSTGEAEPDAEPQKSDASPLLGAAGDLPASEPC
ncbi:hypothetical protein DIPPA_17412 [Diplonema papillatum]|nr:hypothetical protein DIPPA_17412 [Diplonema papillatum]